MYKLIAIPLYILFLFIINGSFVVLILYMRKNMFLREYLSFTSIVSQPIVHKDRECPLVMRYVPGFGVGLYAGILFEPESEIEKTQGVPIIINPLEDAEVKDYYDEFNRTHYLLTMGSALLINHMGDKDGTMIRKTVYDPITLSKTFIAAMAIFPGDQLFVSYGDSWFRYRKIEPISPRHILDRAVTHEDDVQFAPGRIPGCWQNMTYRDDTGILRAATEIKMGEFIEVSRALRIPEWMVNNSHSLKPLVWRKHWSLPRYPDSSYTSSGSSSNDSISMSTNVEEISKNETSSKLMEEEIVLHYQVHDNVEVNWQEGDVWYNGIVTVNHGNGSYGILYEDGTEESAVELKLIRPPQLPEIIDEDYVILLLGGGSYYTHSVPGIREANVFYDWFDLSYLNTEKMKIFIPNAEESRTRPERGEFIHCSDRMFVSFVAGRNIAKDEELVVPLVNRPLHDTGDDEHSREYRYTTTEFSSQCM